MSARRLAVLLSFSGAGGVERMVTNLLPGFIARSIQVDLLAIRADAAPVARLPEGVNLINLRAAHNLTSVLAIARYLRTQRPDAMLAAKDRAIRAAVLARRLSGYRVRLVGRLGTNLSEALAHRHPLLRWWRRAPMRRAYRHVDTVVAVSEGVAADVAKLTQLPAERIAVVRNPVVTPQLQVMAQEQVEHVWFAAGQPPVVLGAGRLQQQKDFSSLLRAFAKIRLARECRLVILGEGGDRTKLEALAASLGIAEHVAMPGHVANPYAYMAKAALFVLSSRWEGSPNVLTEALALGTPVVATDCPSGPREILDGGRIAPLVPVGDIDALAGAMLHVLDSQPDRTLLRAAARDYTQEASVARYLKLLHLD